MQTTEKLLTAKEVARILGLEVQTIYAKAAKGEIPSVKVAGKNLRFRPSDIEQYAGIKIFD